MLQGIDIHAWYGCSHVIRGVHFRLAPGRTMAIVGANGAGKSTLLAVLAGLRPAARGQVLLEGAPIQNLSAEKKVRAGISLVPERRQIFDSLSVEDNLILGAYCRWGKVARDRLRGEAADVYNPFPALRTRRHNMAGNLSGGMQQMLAIGRGLMAKPKVLMLDEPSLGLAPLVVREIFNTLDILKSQGTTILLVEQNARAAMRIADWVYVLDQGKTVLEGDCGSLENNPQMRRAYLDKDYKPQSIDLKYMPV